MLLLDGTFGKDRLIKLDYIFHLLNGDYIAPPRGIGIDSYHPLILPSFASTTNRTSQVVACASGAAPKIRRMFYSHTTPGPESLKIWEGRMGNLPYKRGFHVLEGSLESPLIHVLNQHLTTKQP